MLRRQFLSLAAAPLMPTRPELRALIDRYENLLATLPPPPPPLDLPSTAAALLHAPPAQAEPLFLSLRDRFWDSRHGGFLWQPKPLLPNKQLYGQALALTALAEYTLASRRKEPAELSLRLFDTLDQRAHDSVHGGYVEFFLHDWSTPPVNEPVYAPSTAVGLKSLATHIHLLAALTALLSLPKPGPARDRLLELIAIATTSSLPPTTSLFARDWSPQPSPFPPALGHELIWRLPAACRAARLPLSPYLSLLRSLFSTLPPSPHTPIAALELYLLTSQTSYFEAFRQSPSPSSPTPLSESLTRLRQALQSSP
ncbi:MAG: AGE family epimerase/isomerase [Bryobacter sp.]|nr:AGE family epimerase/isomerase [Bryobacter sp. CoA8 C33]